MIPLIAALLPLASKILDRIPDKSEREKAKFEFELAVKAQELELLKTLQAGDTAQAEINKVEAASTNLFVAGWRPFVGWTCATAFAWAFVLQPLLVFGFAAAGHPVVGLPALDFGTMSSVLLGMLGLGGMRTFEKFKGVTK